MERLKLATIWLGGCSGCHMSLLDMDEWLMDLAPQVDLVYSPLADAKLYPAHVDIALVEGAIANEDHLRLIKEVRQHTTLLISLGDCAVAGNVTALRNPLGDAQQVLSYVYGPLTPSMPDIVPALLDRVYPLHAVVPVDLYLPGCPPPAPRIRAVLEQMLSGETPQLAGRGMLKFG